MIGFNAMGKSLTLATLTVFWHGMPVWAESGETTFHNDMDRFALWNECEPMNLVVEHLDEDAEEINLTIGAIETLVRSRLRAARIFEDGFMPQYLYVNVNVGDGFFGIEVNFKKTVLDLRSDVSSFATTWSTGGAGTHGRDANFILSFLSRFVDQFIDEFLRVNADAC